MKIGVYFRLWGI